MGKQAVRVGVVDIGTNSMRLLITEGAIEIRREAVVTGLGRGVDRSGALGHTEMEKTVHVLTQFGATMTELGVDRRGAVATSATRDASNRSEFVERATVALGVKPDVIDGVDEGRLAYEGAVSDLRPGGYFVTDIGGGSTEFVTATDSKSIDMGSVRLTDRILSGRPPDEDELELSVETVRGMFEDVSLPSDHVLVGVAGTWTTLAIMTLELTDYAIGDTHHENIAKAEIGSLIEKLSRLSVDQTVDSFPAIDPNRAPMILAGAVIAGCILATLGVDDVLVSERDSLDGLARRLLALA